MDLLQVGSRSTWAHMTQLTVRTNGAKCDIAVVTTVMNKNQPTSFLIGPNPKN